MKKILFVVFFISLFIPGMRAQVKVENLKLSGAPCTTLTGDLQLSGMPDTTGGRSMADNYKTWENGRVLMVKFMNNGASQAVKEKVMRYAKEWEQFGNFTLKFVPENTTATDIRILLSSRRDKLGHNSRVGIDASQVLQDVQTMNLDTSDFFDMQYYINDVQTGGTFYKYLINSGKDLKNYNTLKLVNDLMGYNATIRYNEKAFRGTVLHEFGHALGLLHEQSYPGAIKWNVDTVYKHYEKYYNWGKDMVDHNVLRVGEQFFTNGTSYDPLSIMHYDVDAWQTLDGFSVKETNELSPGDKALMAALYPKNKKISDLAVPKVQVLNLNKLEVKKDDALKALVIYPYFEVRTGAKLANAYFVARITTADGMRYILTSSTKYNWGGFAGTYLKMNLLPNTKKRYNLLVKDLKLILPYREIPELAGQDFRIEFCVYQENVATGKMDRFVAYSLSAPLSMAR